MIRLLTFLIVLCPLYAWGASELRVAKGDLDGITDDTLFEITGSNPTDQPQIAIIKIVDLPGAAYHQRVNEERWVLPGPFRILIQPAALQTPQGKFLNLHNILDIHIFTPHNLSFKTLKKRPSPDFKQTIALDFGADKSPLFPGFKKITPSSPHFIQPKPPTAFIRKGVDSLIRDGLKGVIKFQMPIENGIWRLHLWSEDIGEWETLPPLYERRIRINAKTISHTRQNHDEWVANTYLAGEAQSGKTPWQSFGARRGGYLETTVHVTNNLLTLELAGSNAQATTLTGLVIEPLTGGDFPTIQNQRKEWFTARWPFIDSQEQAPPPLPNPIFMFQGENLFIPIHGQRISPIPDIQSVAYKAHSDFTRSTPNSGLLVKKTTRYKPSDLSGGDLIKLFAPPSTHPGVYHMGDLTVHVLKSRAPTIDRSIGIYLETSPHLENAEKQNMQIWCDLDYLRHLGLTAIAPPFSKDIQAGYQRAKSFGFKDVLAYTPLKRHLEETRTALKSRQIDNLILSIADEPSNPGQTQALKQLSSLLQNESPFAIRAGHLNSPKDDKFLQYLDLALVNAGFGVDKIHIDRIIKQKITPWFYNMDNPQLAAGFYLWRTGARGYLQWHGRMPTADPFDPTDGREDDVQMLYPDKSVCSQNISIHPSLINIVNGMSDLRWLLWLDMAAKKHTAARQLKKKLHHQIPPYWQESLSLPTVHWRDLRTEIQKLALSLQR